MYHFQGSPKLLPVYCPISHWSYNHASDEEQKGERMERIVQGKIKSWTSMDFLIKEIVQSVEEPMLFIDTV